MISRGIEISKSQSKKMTVRNPQSFYLTVERVEILTNSNLSSFECFEIPSRPKSSTNRMPRLTPKSLFEISSTL